MKQNPPCLVGLLMNNFKTHKEVWKNLHQGRLDALGMFNWKVALAAALFFVVLLTGAIIPRRSFVKCVVPILLQCRETGLYKKQSTDHTGAYRDYP